eukprot:2314959-Pleurochrysis_carterae.AAC.1
MEELAKSNELSPRAGESASLSNERHTRGKHAAASGTQAARTHAHKQEHIRQRHRSTFGSATESRRRRPTFAFACATKRKLRLCTLSCSKARAHARLASCQHGARSLDRRMRAARLGRLEAVVEVDEEGVVERGHHLRLDSHVHGPAARHLRLRLLGHDLHRVALVRVLLAHGEHLAEGADAQPAE